jgi:RNA polymerase sigma factor (sigma-70 family)
MSRGDRFKADAELQEGAGLPQTLLTEVQIASLVEDYLPLVVSQVDRVWLSSRIGLTRDDLVSAGCFGLLLAARRFDPSRGVGFGVFARSHVHGALMREINAAIRASGAGLDDVLAVDSDAIEPDSLPDENGADEVERTETSEVRDLMECLLTDHERTLLGLYFFEELTLAEVAAVLGGSESSVARAIKAALAKLKAAMAEGDWG